jgi:hypothetical protein
LLPALIWQQTCVRQSVSDNASATDSQVYLQQLHVHSVAQVPRAGDAYCVQPVSFIQCQTRGNESSGCCDAARIFAIQIWNLFLQISASRSRLNRGSFRVQRLTNLLRDERKKVKRLSSAKHACAAIADASASDPNTVLIMLCLVYATCPSHAPPQSGVDPGSGAHPSAAGRCSITTTLCVNSTRAREASTPLVRPLL